VILLSHICRVTDLRDREVINVCDGRRLGFVCDVEIDNECGKIIALIVPEDNNFFSFRHICEIKIPWERIDCLGEDIILVSLDEKDIKPVERKHKWFT
jgi:YlmC/YmxH family sporulation protein